MAWGGKPSGEDVFQSPADERLDISRYFTLPYEITSIIPYLSILLFTIPG